MRRFVVQPEQIEADVVTFDPDQTHHICRVSRFDRGDRIQILVPPRDAYLVELVDVTRSRASARVLSPLEAPRLPPPRLHLCLSVPKFPKVDWIVEKSVELGMNSLWLFTSDFSFLRRPEDLPESKVQRWQKIALSAAQQSGRVEVFDIHPPRPLRDLVGSMNPPAGYRCLICDEGARQPLAVGLNQIAASNPSDVYVFVGSEGGFSDEDRRLLQDLPGASVSLGDQILRVETACVALASVLRYRLRSLQSGG
jgi:16S rRNA (uracil1498-N3)-methyltransferase